MSRIGSGKQAASQELRRSMDISFAVVIPYCLVYLRSQGKVLLIRKSEGRSHEGQWIGLGGKLLVGENPVSSAVREFREESGLILEDPKLQGTFIWMDETQFGIIHVVTGTKWRGTISKSDEGELRWHGIQDLATLDGLASHQRLFLDRVLLDDGGFYSGIAVYQNNKMVAYADSDNSLRGASEHV